MRMRTGKRVLVKALAFVAVFLGGLGAFLVAATDEQDSCTTGSQAGAVTVTDASLDGISVPGLNTEQLRNAATVLKAGSDLGASRRDQTVAVMVAYGESSLRVLNYGDAAGPDSRGLFQQRDNGSWGTLADRMDPYISAKNFYTALFKVEGRDTMSETLAANAVQRNRDPYHYQKHLPMAQAIVNAFSGQTITTTTAGTTETSKIVELARAQMGVPYVWGGETTSGFDCSGLVKYIFAQLGVDLPHSAADQGAKGQEVYTGSGASPAWDSMLPGDVIFLPAGPDSYDHIGIYAGNQKMIHAPTTGDVVKESPLSDYADRQWRVRRMTNVQGAPIITSKQCAVTNTSTTALDTTPVNDNGWASPSAGPITSVFGMRFHPTLGYNRLHSGTDLGGGGCGGAIYAAHSGTVTFAGMDDDLGMVIIDHGSTVETRYLHMEAAGIFVKANQAVTAGQQIAEVGSTGQSTGCHLHFETRVNGEAVDPVPFMAERGVNLGQ